MSFLSSTSAWYPCFAAVLNLAVLASGSGYRLVRTFARCVAIALLTATMYFAHMLPTGHAELAGPAERLVWGVVEIAWWLLMASTLSAVARAYYTLGGRFRQQQFMLDVVETILYIAAFFAIVTDVFGLPLKGVLTTSGALAIVLGLALQSTLSDFFSGLVINITAPYRVGDSIAVDDTTKGKVVEITWRATHLARPNRDLIVIPNSVIAKGRIVNSSALGGPHGAIASFQFAPPLRPSTVTDALLMAVQNCVNIVAEPAATVTITAAAWQAIDYEVTFFVQDADKVSDTLSALYDAAHRHLESFDLLFNLSGSPEGAPTGTPERRLLDGVGVFGLLSAQERSDLAAAMVMRELMPGAVVLRTGDVSDAITIVAYGILSASVLQNGEPTDVMRFGPGEFVGESGPVMGVPVQSDVNARTYAIVYELPGRAIGALFRSRPELLHVLAAKLAERIREGTALILPVQQVNHEHHGLISWID